MTNAAVIAMSNNCPHLEVFRLCIIAIHRPDPITGEAMDEGFGAVVKNCKKLTRLAVSGLLTDKAFSYIGQYGKLLRTLSVAFAGNSDVGLKYVLEGCPMLQKLEIRDSPFGDLALHAGLHHYYNMTSLVEVISRDEDKEEMSEYVETLYMYRSLGLMHRGLCIFCDSYIIKNLKVEIALECCNNVWLMKIDPEYDLLLIKPSNSKGASCCVRVVKVLKRSIAIDMVLDLLDPAIIRS